jgi:hypothetical protein
MCLRGDEHSVLLLNGLGEIMPSGFEITGRRNIEDGSDVVSIIEWQSEKFQAHSRQICSGSRATSSTRNGGSSARNSGRALVSPGISGRNTPLTSACKFASGRQWPVRGSTDETARLLREADIKPVIRLAANFPTPNLSSVDCTWQGGNAAAPPFRTGQSANHVFGTRCKPGDRLTPFFRCWPGAESNHRHANFQKPKRLIR